MINQFLSIVVALVLTGCLDQSSPLNDGGHHIGPHNSNPVVAPDPELVDLLNVAVNETENLEDPAGALSAFCEYEYDYQNEYGTHEPLSCSYEEGKECCAWMYATDTTICGEVWCMQPDTCLWQVEYDSCSEQ